MIPQAVYEQSLAAFLSPIERHLADPRVTEILINGPDEIFVERGGRLTRVLETFGSAGALESAVRVVAQFAGRTLSSHEPVIEARLPDGSRVQVVMAPAARRGPCVAIRRFSRDTLTIDKLIAFGALTIDAAQALSLLVEHKQNVIVAGGTGSGKTSMLNALSSFIPKSERVVVIEDASELQLQGDHVVQLEAQKPDPRGQGGVSIRALFMATLRLRPDRIVVGEIRGGEAIDLIQAMTSGHGGCMSTVHATYPSDTLNRLETMALMAGLDLPLEALRAQLASAVDIVVQTARLRDGARCVTHIVEVGLSRDRRCYQLTPLFVREVCTNESSAAVLRATGRLPRCAELAHANGQRFPSAMYGEKET